MSYSNDYGVNVVQWVDAFSPRAYKQLASAIIWEEISVLQINIRAYEAQLLEWRRNVALWKAHQNRLCDIAKLPEDILVEIWSYCAQTSGDSVEALRDWLAVTHVCSRWRNLALGAHELWRWPCVLRPSLASFLLPRAGVRPIRLSVDIHEISEMGSDAAIESFALARQLLNRAESLILNLKPEARNNLVNSFSSDFFSSLKDEGFKSIRNLKSISINNPNRVPCSLAQARQALNPIGMIQSLPELRSIELFNINILDSPSRLPPLPQITWLSISTTQNNSWDENPQSSLHKVLSSIAMLPNLRHLSLIRVFTPLGTEDHDWLRAHTKPIVLRSLQVMWLASDIQVAQCFIDHVHYPQTAEITFEITSWGRELASLESLLVTSTDITRTGQSIRCLEISTSEASRLSDENYIGFSTRPRFIRPEVDFLLTQGHSDPLPNLPLFCPLQHLERLYCNLASNHFNTEVWKAFGSLPKLQRLSGIRVHEHPELLKVLASFRESGDDIFHPLATPTQNDAITGQTRSTSPQLYFPSLTYLTIPPSRPARLYLQRIMLVRKFWRTHGA